MVNSVSLSVSSCGGILQLCLFCQNVLEKKELKKNVVSLTRLNPAVT